MNVVSRLAAAAPVVTDGAWGTELQARGLAAGAIPDTWNLKRPEDVEAVARAYVEAGSQVILTNTFRANRLALEGAGIHGKAGAINRAGAEISRRMAEGRAHVFGSMGPSGKLLLTGDVNEEELHSAFAEQAEALAEGGAEAILIETMADLREAAIAIRAALRTGLAVVASMVFDSGKNKDRTMMGATPERAAAQLAEAGAAAIGANCGSGIAGYIPICERLRAATSLPLWIKPNAGLPDLVDGRAVYRTTPEEYAASVPALAAAGATFIGGCCGTGPAYIRAARAALAKEPA